MEKHDMTNATPKYSLDGPGAWVLRYEHGHRYCSERFFFEDAAREVARLLPTEYTNIRIELDREGY